jgi:hypothetical protein
VGFFSYLKTSIATWLLNFFVMNFCLYEGLKNYHAVC